MTLFISASICWSISFFFKNHVNLLITAQNHGVNHRLQSAQNSRKNQTKSRRELIRSLCLHWQIIKTANESLLFKICQWTVKVFWTAAIIVGNATEYLRWNNWMKHASRHQETISCRKHFKFELRVIFVVICLWSGKFWAVFHNVASPCWLAYKKQEINTKSYMVMHGCMNVINCPYKSMACMHIINSFIDNWLHY